MSFWEALSRILRPRRVGQPDSRGAETYSELRRQVLGITPQSLGVSDAPAEMLLGLLMETGHEKAVVTMVVLVDDTVSLYFSNGGGMIGVGAHPGPRDAGRRLLQKARGFMSTFVPVAEPPTPSLGQTQFIAIMSDGKRFATAREQDLGRNLHPLSPLFHAAHEVITEIRLQSERQAGSIEKFSG